MAEEIRLFTLYTEDRKFSAVIGTYGKLLNISVFESNVSAGPVVKLIFTPTTVIQFKTILEVILTNREAKEVDLGLLGWNKELNKNEFRSSVKVGRDQDTSIYFEFVGSNHKEPIRMAVVTDNKYLINGMEPGKVGLTEAGARAILGHLTALIEAALVKDTPMPKVGGGGGVRTTPVGGAGTATGEDVPF